jgi:hypothetical protein
MDSTVKVGSAQSPYFVDDILLGSVFDPQSQYLQPFFVPLLSSGDPYNLDSVFIYGSYVKVNPNPAIVDTLYTWIVWGAPSNTNVFSKKASNLLWGSPINTWKDTVIGPKIAGATGAAGNKLSAAASQNKILIKYALKTTDQPTNGSGYLKRIGIALPSPITIPAGNIVSCFYTYVPGSKNTFGDCTYSFSGSSLAQNQNGFAGAIWQQNNPVIKSVADYQSYQVDETSYCMGAAYYKKQRHAVYSTNFRNSMWGDLTVSPVILYSINGISTVGVNELENKGFTLVQNYPNPFTDNTIINYHLSKSAENVRMEVYDIRGLKVFEKVEKNKNQGDYAVEIDGASLTSGIYFYSLVVDGNKTTKKMVVTN